MENLVWWLMTGAVSALCVIAWTAFKTVIHKLDEFDAGLHKLQQLVSDEMRAMDVRIARLEAHIWPHRVDK